MNRRMAEAWARHQEETGHLDGEAFNTVAYCLNCDWVYTEGAESRPEAITLRDPEEGWSEAASTFVRDLDSQRMAEWARE